MFLTYIYITIFLTWSLLVEMIIRNTIWLLTRSKSFLTGFRRNAVHFTHFGSSTFIPSTFIPSMSAIQKMHYPCPKNEKNFEIKPLWPPALEWTRFTHELGSPVQGGWSVRYFDENRTVQIDLLVVKSQIVFPVIISTSRVYVKNIVI